MTDQLKRLAAAKALDFVSDGMIIGVGSGSTVNCFIEALGSSGINIKAAVCSSLATEALLKSYSVPIMDLNDVSAISVYIDGADQIDRQLVMIKGGGAALTREKIVASASDGYICIVDQTKLVDCLSDYAVPVEVIPMARKLVVRKLAELGAKAIWREGVVTDNGNHILDVTGLDLSTPCDMECRLNSIAGVVENGIFAFCPANVVVIGKENGIEVIAL